MPETDDTPETPPGRRATSASDEQPVLPSVTRDESAEGWGDEPGDRDAEWYRRETPPHHG